MRKAFLAVLIIHGLIHLFGFAETYGLLDLGNFSHPISKVSGILGFAAFLLLTTTSLLLVLKKKYWWAFSFIAVLVSQSAILGAWTEAKFGTVANLIIIIAAIVGYKTWRYSQIFFADVKNSLGKIKIISPNPLTEIDLQHLPEAIKKYIRYAGCIGRPKVTHFKIELTGKIRKNEQSEWMPFTSEQYNSISGSTRLFFMKAEMKGLPVAGYHKFENGKASMDIRLFSLIQVQYQDGPEMDVAETVTFFNDMCCMAPATLIDRRISWEELDSSTVKGTFTSNGISISAVLYFNDKGELVNFVSNDRYAADAGKKLPWATPLKNYNEINGFKLAGYADAIYSYPEGDLTYGEFTITSINYNNEVFPDARLQKTD